mmetsp:Transcript_109920/g.354929  ORF Transcript_109920/g.354929 Transcript_109920/m.354929 type:complete len:346 (+) Transcript_109920:349-1386(+)
MRRRHGGEALPVEGDGRVAGAAEQQDLLGRPAPGDVGAVHVAEARGARRLAREEDAVRHRLGEVHHAERIGPNQRREVTAAHELVLPVERPHHPPWPRHINVREDPLELLPEDVDDLGVGRKLQGVREVAARRGEEHGRHRLVEEVVQVVPLRGGALEAAALPWLDRPEGVFRRPRRFPPGLVELEGNLLQQAHVHAGDGPLLPRRQRRLEADVRGLEDAHGHGDDGHGALVGLAAPAMHRHARRAILHEADRLTEHNVQALCQVLDDVAVGVCDHVLLVQVVELANLISHRCGKQVSGIVKRLVCVVVEEELVQVPPRDVVLLEVFLHEVRRRKVARIELALAR